MTVNLPIDVILQILSRLPSKSIARCRCVSKLWASLLTLCSPYFTDLFFTQSITRPRLLFAIRNEDSKEWYLYSSPQISSKNSVTAEFHMSFPKTYWCLHMITLVSGLIYCPSISNYNSPMLCNPTTRKCFSLPNLTRAAHSFLGYDPISKQFMVLAICSPLPSNQVLPSSYQILNLESGKLSWRSLDCPLHHSPIGLSICINGILYYNANSGMQYPPKIVCFDFHSEEFKFIDQPWCYGTGHFVNVKGKLGGITTEYGKERLNVKLSLFVLEDVEKEEWSKHVYLLPPIVWYKRYSHYSIVGVTSTGDVVLSLSYTKFTNNPFYVYFFNLEKNILRRVEIKGFEAFEGSYFLQGFVDYVEDLKALNWSWFTL